MAEYTHLKELMPMESMINSINWEDYEFYEKLVKYDNKKVIAVQKQIKFTEEPLILVPGFVEQYKYKQKDGIYFSEVSKIPKELREDISKTLHKEGLEGMVSYW